MNMCDLRLVGEEDRLVSSCLLRLRFFIWLIASITEKGNELDQSKVDLLFHSVPMLSVSKLELQCRSLLNFQLYTGDSGEQLLLLLAIIPPAAASAAGLLAPPSTAASAAAVSYSSSSCCWCCTLLLLLLLLPPSLLHVG